MVVLKILGFLLIALVLMIMLGDYFLLFFLISLVVFVFVVIVRLIADLYWWGKDKGEW